MDILRKHELNEELLKARTHKYIKRVRKGNKWIYYYKNAAGKVVSGEKETKTVGGSKVTAGDVKKIMDLYDDGSSIAYIGKTMKMNDADVRSVVKQHLDNVPEETEETKEAVKQSDMEMKAIDKQSDWISKRFGKRAADNANYGWGVDSDDEGASIATKIYGHGVLTTEVNYRSGKMTHSFEES